MSLIKVQGVIIKSINISESDKIVTLFSDKLGKIDAVVHGARRSRSKFLSSTQPFCYCDYVVYKGKNLYTINQSSIIESFQSILMNLDKLAYGSYFLELVDNITEKEMKYVSILAMLLKTLYILVHGDVELELLRLTVSFKAISLAGYMPRLKGCVKCGSKMDYGVFSIKEGGILCSKCSIDGEYVYELNRETLHFLHTLKNIKLEDLRYIKYERKMVEYLQNILTKYIMYYTEKDFKSISLINTIKEKGVV